MSKEESLTTVPFDGQQASWRMWSMRYVVKCEIRGYEGILSGNVKIPADDDTNLSKEKEEIKKGNKIVFAELLLSCSTEVSFGCVASSTTDK